jgi:anaerobic ribonucleoside-triphosphate reductase activating protein
MMLNLADVAAPSWANGPGARGVIFVQGCRIHCPGCHNPHTWSHEPRHLCTVDALVEWYQNQPGLRGLTLSGGEPFEQAAALAKTCRVLRANGADVVVFTGFERSVLDSGSIPHATELLSEVDLLIDGPFRAESPCEWPLRGSTNQALHFLTDRIRPSELEGLPRTEWIGSLDSAQVTGFGTGFMARVLTSSGDDF